MVDEARESEVSITNLARAASKRVFRLRPLFQFEAMTPDEMRTLIEGQVKTAALELRK